MPELTVKTHKAHLLLFPQMTVLFEQPALRAGHGAVYAKTEWQ